MIAAEGHLSLWQQFVESSTPPGPRRSGEVCKSPSIPSFMFAQAIPHHVVALVPNIGYVNCTRRFTKTTQLLGFEFSIMLVIRYALFIVDFYNNGFLLMLRLLSLPTDVKEEPKIVTCLFIHRSLEKGQKRVSLEIAWCDFWCCRVTPKLESFLP